MATIVLNMRMLWNPFGTEPVVVIPLLDLLVLGANVMEMKAAKDGHSRSRDSALKGPSEEAGPQISGLCGDPKAPAGSFLRARGRVDFGSSLVAEDGRMNGL